MTERPGDGRTGTRPERAGGPTDPPPACMWPREVLPLALSTGLAPGEADALRSHLATCGECRREQRLLARLFRARPETPGELIEAVLDRLDEERLVAGGGSESPRHRRFRRPRVLGLSAAAALVLALGVGVLQEIRQPGNGVWSLALEPSAELWVNDEWMVAGEPLLEGLSEETLLALLEEIEP